MIVFLRHTLAAAFLLPALGAALPKVTVENVNGFEVHFVDLGRGDKIAATYRVPFGTLSESGEFMGRAHFLEHMMHKGSREFPGANAYKEAMRESGVSANASTGYGATFYHASGSQRGTQNILQVFLAPLAGLEWNPQHFESEREVVINEVVSEGARKDSFAFHGMMFTQLLPPGHPWNHAPWGDRQNLSAMKLESLKEFYYANYTPKNIKVAIEGNFSDAAFFEQVKQWTREYLQPARDRNDPARYRQQAPPLSTKWAPSLFANPNSPIEGERRLYVESPQIRKSMVVMEADLAQFGGRPEAIDMLVGFLNLNAPGTPIYTLRSLGWGTDISVYTEKIGNKVHLVFNAQLSEQGLKHLTEFNTVMFQALRSLQLNGPTAETLNILKDSARRGLERAALSVDDFMFTYSEFTNDKRPFADQVQSMMDVSSRDVATAALLFHPSRALYATMGPKLDEMELDSTYQRHYKFDDNRAALRQYAATMEETAPPPVVPELTVVEISNPVPSEESGFSQTSRDDFLPERFALDFRNDLPDTAVSVNFNFAPTSQKDLVVIDLILGAFNERYAGQMNYLDSIRNVSLGSGRRKNMLMITGSSDTANSVTGLEWMLRELAQFRPTVEELERARENYAAGANQNHTSAYSAQIALWEMIGHVDPMYITFTERRDLAHSLEIDKIVGDWDRLRTRANREFVMVGPFSSIDFVRLKAAAHELAPESLSEEETHRVDTLSDWKAQSQEFGSSEIKPGSSVGVVRAYRGPDRHNVRELAAFEALSSLLHAKISNHNRDRGLGYIHGALTQELDRTHTHMILQGQADSEEKLKLTIEGWEHVLAEIRDGNVSRKEFETSILDVLHSLDSEQTSARDLLASYSAAQNLHRDALNRTRIIEALKVLTPEHVLKVAEKYILHEDVPTVQLTSCEGRLTKRGQ